MSSLNLSVNGRSVKHDVEARTSLADFLREKLHLTGTHLGCEQGVCGACTVMVDGVPVRSCISNANSCSGAEVRTIEHFDDDALMIELRHAFNVHHGLQCGFCTPGMLVMAHDLVRRLVDADEDRIRIELAGNLCRCTGYSGIVKAVREVILARQTRGEDVAYSAAIERRLGPAGSGHGAAALTTTPPPSKANPQSQAAQPQLGKPGKVGAGAAAVKQSFIIDHPLEIVWQKFGDVPAMVRCIPGATMVGTTDDGSFQINMRIKMGPIGAQFTGIAEQERDEQTQSGVIYGAGRDERSASLAQGELNYSLHRAEEGTATRVELEVKYALSGALGQFARGGIVSHFIRVITGQFAENFQRSLSPEADQSGAPESSELNLGGNIIVALKSWLGDFFSRFFSR